MGQCACPPMLGYLLPVICQLMLVHQVTSQLGRMLFQQAMQLGHTLLQQVMQLDRLLLYMHRLQVQHIQLQCCQHQDISQEHQVQHM